MEFQRTAELKAYMEKKHCTTILAELVEINNTDLEVAEFHYQLADGKKAAFFVEKKRYRRMPTEWGEVLLPPVPVELAETVTFGLRSFLFVRMVTGAGLKA